MSADCAFVGDSIAVGLWQQNLNCANYAQVGAAPDFILKNYKGLGGERKTVISLGSNWPSDPNLKNKLIEIRRSLKSRTVIWIVPYNRQAARAVIKVAEQFNDAYIDLAPIQTRDGIHPNYRELDRRVDRVGR